MKFRIRYTTTDIHERTILAPDEETALARFYALSTESVGGHFRNVKDVTALDKEVTL